MITRRGMVAAAAAAPTLLAQALARAETVPPPAQSPPPSPGARPPAPPLISELLRPVVTFDAAISPNGTQVAVARESRDGDKRLAYLAIQPVGPDATPRRVNIGDCFVEKIEWGNDERLLIWVALDKIGGKPTGMWFYGYFFPIPVRRVLSVDADGKNPHVLFENQSKVMKRSFSAAAVIDLLPDRPREVLMQVANPGTGVEALYTVDIYTGAATLLEKGTSATTRWVTQKGVPVLRYSRNSRGTVYTIEARAPGESDWKLVRKLRRDDFSRIEREFDYVGSTDEAGVLLVTSREAGEETNALRTFDLKTLTAGPIIAHRPDRDVEGAFVDENGRYMGAKFIEDRIGYDFADKGFTSHFRALDRFLGQECNLHFFDVSADRSRYLFFAYGPRQPGAYYLYDRDAKRLDPLGECKPWLSEDRLAKVEPLSVKTRDGAMIGAYLTVPITPGPYPLVVLPHGGPEVRDSLEFSLFAQTLAAQGWLVLQPNYRGSGGFGRSFADAGRRRWGDRMQEDVEDAVAHVRASGRVDGDRIAICGSSYGGYAALMGVVRNAVPYRRAVSISGLSDLPALIAHERREDGADSPTYEYVVRTIGDPKADLAMLQAASPRLRVGEIKVPVLLIHGDADGIAPYEQSKTMAEALKKAGKAHTFETLPGEGHGDWSTETWTTVLTKTVNFLREGFRA